MMIDTETHDDERTFSAFDDAPSKTFDVDKPIHLAQLTDEITDAVNTPVMIALIGEYGVEPSKDKPQTLEITPDSIDGRTVRGKIEAHVPDEDYGVDLGLREATEKILNDDAVTIDDLKKVLKNLLNTP